MTLETEFDNWFQEQVNQLIQQGKTSEEAHRIKQYCYHYMRAVCRRFQELKIDYMKLTIKAMDRRTQDGDIILRWNEYLNDNDEINNLVRAYCPFQFSKLHEIHLPPHVIDYFASFILPETVNIPLKCVRWYEGAERILARFNNKLRTRDNDFISFWVAKIYEPDHVLQEQLFRIVLASRHTDSINIAASNAITILNVATISFSMMDLSGIKIRGAYLRNGIFDSVNFQDADLSEVDFSGSWLRGANFSKACLDKINFGENPGINFCLESSRSSSSRYIYYTISSNFQWMVLGNILGEIIFFEIL